MPRLLKAPGIQLSEQIVTNDSGLVEIQVLKTGSFSDPRYGKFSITRKMFSEMMDNFNRKTRGIDIALDYAHQVDGEAAGWFKQLSEKDLGNGQFGLFATIEPTGAGKKTLNEKTYKYVSADFDPNYKDNEEGKSHGCVLEGAALTNRPVVKGMQAIQLSEMEDEGQPGYDELISEVNELKTKYQPLMDMLESSNMSIEDLKALITKPTGDLPMTPEEQKQLDEMKAENDALKAASKANEEKLLLSEKNSKFDKMLASGKACEAQRKPFIEGDMEKFASLQSKVKLSEVGSQVEEEDEEVPAGSVKKDVEDEIAEEAKKLSEGGKMKLSEAIKEVAARPEFKARHEKKFSH